MSVARQQSVAVGGQRCVQCHLAGLCGRDAASLPNGHTASVFARFLTLAYSGGPIGRPRSAVRVVILHTLYGRVHASF